MENREKMPKQERAKQFMPFAALKGYEEALRKQEALHEGQLAKREEGIQEESC